MSLKHSSDIQEINNKHDKYELVLWEIIKYQPKSLWKRGLSFSFALFVFLYANGDINPHSL